MSETKSGLSIPRLFSTSHKIAFDSADYETRSCVISDPDGSIVFELRDAEVPKSWSQLASDILISKYFRKAGLFGDKNKSETSVRQVISRIVNAITNFGSVQGYFATAKDTENFKQELTYLLLHQYAAFNSPVWFNCGLSEAYEIKGSSSGTTWSVFDEEGNPRHNYKARPTKNSYVRPQCSACFIQEVEDSLTSIFDLVKKEAIVYKYGSGTGSDFSKLRGKGEPLSGGGTSSGLISWLKVLDTGAGSIKSGGTTRRAASMRTLNMDHPDIVDFIQWKQKEERKAQALIKQGYPADFNGEAYGTVSGQNSNNSVRITDEFMEAVQSDGEWHTTFRTTGEVANTYKARELFDKIVDAAWQCADPGVQFDTAIQKWHTCKNTGPIRSSNPCSEYLFLGDTACNLASINLLKFVSYVEGKPQFDVENFRHACRIIFLAQEILVDHSSYPTESIAQNSHEYRPLGLGYANLGAMLMSLGIPYNSDQGRAIAGSVTALLTGSAYHMSANIAEVKGPFKGYKNNEDSIIQVMEMHKTACANLPPLSNSKQEAFLAPIRTAALSEWYATVDCGKVEGYRNAQATVLAPTGTIGLLMDCATTGVEPDFSIVKSKKLAGGGHFKIVNQSVTLALKNLGYAPEQIDEMLTYITGTGALPGKIIADLLSRQVFSQETTRKIQKALPACFTIDQAFNKVTVGQELYERFGITVERTLSRKLLAELLEISIDALQELEYEVLGHLTVEGAPHLAKEDYAIFDCANKCGMLGTRFIDPMAHVYMLGAVQPFLSGTASKTINLPNSASRDDVREVYFQAWKSGVKAVALYRDGSKSSQPLSSSSEIADTTNPNEANRQLDIAALVRGLDDSQISELQRALLEHPVAEDVRIKHFGLLQPRRGREQLTPIHRGTTYKLYAGPQKFWLRTGEYEDGRLGEIFIDVHKEGSIVRALMNHFAMAVSLGLQHGVPLQEYVEMFTFTSYEPSGPVRGHSKVKFCSSPLDAIFRILAVDYLNDETYANIKPSAEPVTSSIPPPAMEDFAGIPPLSMMGDYPIVTQVETKRVGLEKYANARDNGSSIHTPKLVGGAVIVDTPPCPSCGHLTVRNGTCFKCINCGSSLGCS